MYNLLSIGRPCSTCTCDKPSIIIIIIVAPAPDELCHEGRMSYTYTIYRHIIKCACLSLVGGMLLGVSGLLLGFLYTAYCFRHIKIIWLALRSEWYFITTNLHSLSTARG